jgi:hypothetical protein
MFLSKTISIITTDRNFWVISKSSSKLEAPCNILQCACILQHGPSAFQNGGLPLVSCLQILIQYIAVILEALSSITHMTMQHPTMTRAPINMDTFISKNKSSVTKFRGGEQYSKSESHANVIRHTTMGRFKK